MKLGLTASTRRSEQVLVAHGEEAVATDEAPPEMVRRGRRAGSRLPSGARAMALSPSIPPRSTAPAPRKERNALDSKRRILEAAQSEFAAKGFDGARLGTIARAAEVQQALIHHYFGDKEGLHGEVVRSGLAAMTEGVWELLSRMDAPAEASTTRAKASTAKASAKAKTSPAAKAKAKRTSALDLRTLAEAFVELLLKFFATNGSFLAILRHEARRDGDGATSIVQANVGPIFDGIVARLDAMRARGDVKKDVDARHLVLSCVAMVAFPFQEEPFVKAIWPADWHGEAFLEERKKHIVAMILARVAP